MMIGYMHLIKVDNPRVKTAELLTVNFHFVTLLIHLVLTVQYLIWYIVCEPLQCRRYSLYCTMMTYHAPHPSSHYRTLQINQSS